MTYQNKFRKCQKKKRKKRLKKDLINGYSFELGRKYFGNNGSQNYQIFHPLFNTLQLHCLDFTKVTLKISIDLSTEAIKQPDLTLRPELKVK